MPQSAIHDETEDKPLDPAVEKVRRKLVRFVAINLGLLFIALMAVVGAVVYKSRSSAPDTPVAVGGEIPGVTDGGMAEGEIVLPAGARMLSQSLSGTRILIDAELAGGGRALFLYDAAEGRMIGRFDVVAK